MYREKKEISMHNNWYIIAFFNILFLLLKNKPHLNRVTAPKIYGLAMNYDNLLRKWECVSEIFVFFAVSIFEDGEKIECSKLIQYTKNVSRRCLRIFIDDTI